LEHDPEKVEPGFSEKIMLDEKLERDAEAPLPIPL
jgi:hypothetical protein